MAERRHADVDINAENTFCIKQQARSTQNSGHRYTEAYVQKTLCSGALNDN